MGPWPITPNTFSGTKFRQRYGLKTDDFYVNKNLLYLASGITIPDDPPILEVNDTPLPSLVGVIQSDTSFSPALKNVLLRLVRGQL